MTKYFTVGKKKNIFNNEVTFPNNEFLLVKLREVFNVKESHCIH